jgi:EAL domain-containing protein (putative c-di-GMP-specific phosphodiesterase class I)
MSELSSTEVATDSFLRDARVLLAEDEDALRRALARSLTRAGCRVTEARDGTEAAELVGRESFDVIVTDIKMPGHDGLEVLRAARGHDLDVPIILMTAAPDLRTALESIEYGAFQYITKPVDLVLLNRIVSRAVGFHKMAHMKRLALELVGTRATEAGDRAGLEATFRRALQGLWMAYQPIVQSSDFSIYGYEALLRSTEPALPHPGAILDAAERLGALNELGQKVRSAAAEPIANAPERGFLFVNLHTRDLQDESLYSPRAPLSAMAERVVLEITERASLAEIPDAREKVARLRALGYRIAIDDLGAGYAGLTSFTYLEPEIVKLDMSLVRGIAEETTKQKLVRSMTSLCKDLGMLVVAEGIETKDERDTVISLGCDLLQGYLFARPGKPFPEIAA